MFTYTRSHLDIFLSKQYGPQNAQIGLKHRLSWSFAVIFDFTKISKSGIFYASSDTKTALALEISIFKPNAENLPGLLFKNLASGIVLLLVVAFPTKLEAILGRGIHVVFDHQINYN